MIRSLRGVLKDLAVFTPLKLALWCLAIFVLRDLAHVIVEVVSALKSMGYGPDFFIQIARLVRWVSG